MIAFAILGLPEWLSVIVAVGICAAALYFLKRVL